MNYPPRHSRETIYTRRESIPHWRAAIYKPRESFPHLREPIYTLRDQVYTPPEPIYILRELIPHPPPALLIDENPWRTARELIPPERAALPLLLEKMRRSLEAQRRSAPHADQTPPRFATTARLTFSTSPATSIRHSTFALQTSPRLPALLFTLAAPMPRWLGTAVQPPPGPARNSS